MSVFYLAGGRGCVSGEYIAYHYDRLIHANGGVIV